MKNWERQNVKLRQQNLKRIGVIWYKKKENNGQHR